jgi:transcriptional regulator with XRE-family HTH domain
VCAQRIRERRRTLGLTQREVAGRLARLGSRTTNRTLSAMENGRGLDLGLLPELAQSLECTVTYLIGLAADPHSWEPDRHARRMSKETVPVTRGRRTGSAADFPNCRHHHTIEVQTNDIGSGSIARR